MVLLLLTTLLIGSLLNQALVELVNHGEILQGLRSAVYGWAESLLFPPLRWAVMPLRALHCPFCVSHWTGLATSMGLAPAIGLPWWWGLLLWLPTVRLSNIVHDLIGDRSRTPGSGMSPRLKDARPEDLEAELMERLGGTYRLVNDETAEES